MKLPLATDAVEESRTPFGGSKFPFTLTVVLGLLVGLSRHDSLASADPSEKPSETEGRVSGVATDWPPAAFLRTLAKAREVVSCRRPNFNMMKFSSNSSTCGSGRSVCCCLKGEGRSHLDTTVWLFLAPQAVFLIFLCGAGFQLFGDVNEWKKTCDRLAV